MNQAIATAIDYRRVPMTMVVIALLAIPFAYAQTHAGVLEGHPTFVMLFGVAALCTAGFLAWWFVFRHLPAKTRRSPYLILFAVFAFATMLDLLIALSVLGYTELMNAYFETGEPYLKSSHGMAINLWDGTAHLAMYAGMSYYLVKSQPHRPLALLWAGSLVGSCVVYMVGNLIGEYAEHIEPSYALNIPFMVVPVFYAWKIINEDTTPVATTRAPLGAQDYALAVALLALAAICTFRLVVALNPDISLTRDWATHVEPYLSVASRYPQVQMLVYGFGLMPFAILAAIALWRRPSRGLAIWAWFFAGLVAQGQFGHIVATLHAAANDARYAPGDGFAFWAVNLAVALIPLWFALRYERKLRGARG